MSIQPEHPGSFPKVGCRQRCTEGSNQVGPKPRNATGSVCPAEGRSVEAVLHGLHRAMLSFQRASGQIRTRDAPDNRQKSDVAEPGTWPSLYRGSIPP